MAKLMLSLALLCVSNLVHDSAFGPPAVRSEAVAEKFVLATGPRSALFSQCVAKAATVEGTLYSIAACENEEFVRFVPLEKMEFNWVNLGPAQDIIECAQKACNSSIYMFEFDGSCKIAVNASYDPRSEQGCDEAATSVVYITSRPFNAIDGQVIPFGEFYGCLYSAEEGFTYGEGGKLVSEVELPPPATCCPISDDGYCFLEEKIADKITFCEAEARCKAKGVPLPTKTFVDDFANPEVNLSNIYVNAAWLNLHKVDGKWLWMPEMVEFPESDFSEAPQDCQCATFHRLPVKPPSTPVTEIYSRRCSFTIETLICYEPNTILPQCP